MPAKKQNWPAGCHAKKKMEGKKQKQTNKKYQEKQIRLQIGESYV